MGHLPLSFWFNKDLIRFQINSLSPSINSGITISSLVLATATDRTSPLTMFDHNVVDWNVELCVFPGASRLAQINLYLESARPSSITE